MRRADSFEKTLMLERLKAGGEGDNRGWNGWMALPTQWTLPIQWTLPTQWVWVNSRSGWWTGRPGVLQSMGLQRVGHDWTTEMNWTGHCFTILCQFLVCNNVIQLYAYIYPSLLSLPPCPLGHRGEPRWAPGAMHGLPLAVLHTVVCVCQCHSLNHPTLSFPLLCLHLYSCPANRFVRTIFLDSIYIYMH